MEVTTLVMNIESADDTSKRIVKQLDHFFGERAAAEARRRQVWILEEEERRRRIRAEGNENPATSD
jgi:hypothetical protein